MAWYPARFDVSTNEDWRDPIILTNKATGLALPLTGYAFDMHVRETPESDYAVMALSTANGRLLVPAPANGTIIINVAVDFMRTIRPGLYGFDMRWLKDGVRQTFLRGEVQVNASFTR